MKLAKLFFIFIIFISIFSCKKETTTSTTIEEKKVNTCKVIFVEGNAFVLKTENNQWEQLAAGDTLKENDTLKTEAKTNVEIQFNEGSVVRIKENSELKVSKLYSEKDINNTKLFINSGTILAKPEKQTEGSNFEIETKSITAGVRGTEFIVITGNNVSKVAVKSGKVVIKKKLTIESLEKVREIDVEFAKKIEDAVTGEIELLKDEKIVVSDEEVSKFNQKAEKEINNIVNDLESGKATKGDINEIIEKVEKEKINELSANSSRILKKENVTEKDKNKEINFEEFENIGKNKEENVSGTTITTIKETKISKDDIKKEDIKEENKEKEKQLVTVIDKINNLGFSFSEKNTGITTDGKLIYVASDTNKSLLAIDQNGKLIWKFSNPKLKKVESFAIPYKNLVVFASYDAIFVLNSNNGSIYQSLDITNGTSFWANPVRLNNNVIIPTSRYTYKFDGNSISTIDEIAETQGQTYFTAYKNSLYISDSLYQNIKEFDFNSNSITWTSDNLVSSSYISPVVAGKYLVIADNDGNVYRFNISNKAKNYDILKIGTG